MASPLSIRCGDAHGGDIERATQSIWKELEHLFRDAIKRRGLVRMHFGKNLAEICVFALERETPLLAVLAGQLDVRRRAHGSVEAEDPRVIGACPIVGVIDAPVDLARLRTHGRRLCDG